MLQPSSTNVTTTGENSSNATTPTGENARVLTASFSQQRLWFLDQLEQNTSVYNIFTSMIVKGRLDVPVFEEVLNEIVRRHEVLRTTFMMVEGELKQVIAPELRLQITLVELDESMPEEKRRAEAQRLATVEGTMPFDLANDPLIRCMLVRLNEEEHVLSLTMHHIISDGWSLGVFIREVAPLYEAFRAGKPSPLSALPIQYGDFAQWQREWLSGKRLEDQLSYWRKHLAGAPPLTKVPTDKPRPRIQTFRGSFMMFNYPAHLAKALDNLSRKEGVTMFMMLVAAFQTLFLRYTGQEKIPVGTPVAGRTRPEIEGLIGFFINTLLIGTDLSGDPTFRQLLRRVRDVTLGAFAHQFLPYDKLVEHLQPERSLSYTPLFQVSLALQNLPMPEVEMPGLKFSPMPVNNNTSKFDLTFAIRTTNQGVDGSVEYKTDLFDRATIARMIGHFETLLESITDNPDQPLSELSMLPWEERQQLVEWNDTQRDYPLDQNVQRLVEEQAARTPEAAAVAYEGERLTYAELNSRANRVAHFLKNLKVGPETPVGILLDDSTDTAVAMLGALKAGGTCVLLNPSAKADRINAAMSETRMPVVLTQKRWRGKLQTGGVRAVTLDADWAAISKESEANLDIATPPDHLAFILYDLDGTEKPKGVMLPHGAVTNQIAWLRENFGLTESDRVLRTGPMSTATSVSEVFWTLASGACLVLTTSDQRQEGEYLSTLLTEQEVTTLHTTPSILHLLLAGQGLESARALRQVFCSGERLTPESQQAFFKKTEAELHNFYAIKEASGVVAHTTCSRNTNAPRSVIGRPAANTQIYILDRNMREVPVGVPGELYVGGAGLMRGYFNRPELTAERLVSNWGSMEPGVRLFKTGDIGRHRADGHIEYVGRADRQIKPEGVPAHLEEVEDLLNRHPAVARSVVVVREDTPGEERLVGYVVAAPGHRLSAVDMQDYLREQLPEYMPSVLPMVLPALPLTPAGKIDFQELPEPEEIKDEARGSGEGEVYVAPRDLLELQLAQIWEELLEVRPISVTSNFFSLGGHSLSAVNMMIQIQEKFGQELPLTDLFQATTIESIANILRQQDSPYVRSPLVPIQPNGSKRPFFCVHAVGGNALTYVQLAQALGLEQPFYGFQAPGLSGEQEPLDNIEEIATRYVEAMRAAQPQGPYLIGGWSFGGVVAFEMAKQLRSVGQEVALLAIIDSWTPKALGHMDPLDNSAALLTNFFMDQLKSAGKELTPERTQEEFMSMYNDLKDLDEDAQMNYILERARRGSMVIPGTELKQFDHLLQVFRKNFAALNVYRPEPSDEQVVLFRAMEVEEVYTADPTLGWSELTTKSVEIHDIPGNHYTMLGQPQVQALADELRDCFDRVLVHD